MAQIAALAVLAGAQVYEGKQKRKLGYQQAKALNEAGLQEMAATTADLAELERDKKEMESRAIAVAAASGAGVNDPTVVNLIGDLNAEGEYRLLQRLYAGQVGATSMYNEATVARREGEAAERMGYVKGATTVMSAYMGGNLSVPIVGAQKAVDKEAAKKKAEEEAKKRAEEAAEAERFRKEHELWMRPNRRRNTPRTSGGRYGYGT